MESDEMIETEFLSELRGLQQRVARLEGSESELGGVLAALGEGHEKYKTLTESFKAGVYRQTMGPGSKILEANSSIAEMFGYGSREEFLSRDVSDLFQNAEDRRRIEEQILNERPVRDERIELNRADGTPFTGLISYSAVRDEKGELKYCLGVIEDITKRDREEQLQLAFGTLQGTVHSLTAMVEMMNPDIAASAQRVSRLAVAIGKELGLSEEDITGIGLAATLHDIGKMHVPPEILGSPDKLAEQQFSLVKDHPEVGYNILKTVELRTAEFPWPIAEMVLQHHERMDGSGYPHELAGEDILPGARILAVADVMAAMTADRPDRPAPGVDKALEELSRHRGALYDPVVVDACVKLLREDAFRLD